MNTPKLEPDTSGTPFSENDLEWLRSSATAVRVEGIHNFVGLLQRIGFEENILTAKIDPVAEIELHSGHNKIFILSEKILQQGIEGSQRFRFKNPRITSHTDNVVTMKYDGGIVKFTHDSDDIALIQRRVTGQPR